MADATYGPKVYKKDGGDREVVASGGSLDVESGGEIDIESGGSLKLAGTAVTATAAELNAIAGGGLSSTELGVLDGVVGGTVTADKALIVDSSKDISTINAATITTLTSTTVGAVTANVSGVVNQTAGAAAAAVAQRFGATATEGFEIKVIDETVSGFTGAKTFDLTEDVPAGAVILSVQGNIETAVTAGGTSVKVSIGLAGGDVDKYGKTGTLAQNQKIDTIPDWAVLSGAEDVEIGIVVTDGSTLGDTNASAGAVRVRIVYAVPNSLDDAA